MTTLPADSKPKRPKVHTPDLDMARGVAAMPAARNGHSSHLSAAPEEEILSLKMMLLSARDDRVRDIATHLAHLTNLQSALTASEQEKERLDQRNRDLALRSLTLSRDIQRLTHDNETVRAERARLQAAQNAAEQALSKLSEDIQRLAQENKIVHAECTRLEAERNAAEQSFGEISKDHVAKQREVSELTARLQEAEDQAQSLRAMLSEDRQQHERQVVRTQAELGQLRDRLAERDQDLSRELAIRDQLTRELALARRNFEVADHGLRLANQLEDIAARTSSINSPSLPRLKGRRQFVSALKRIRRGMPTGSLLAIERLRRELGKSPLFNAAWYLSQRPDLANQDLLDHFVSHGIDEGTSPHPLIDVDWIAKNTGQDRQSALRGYLLSGRYTELRPTALFDVDYYHKAARLSTSADALSHYLQHGRASGLSPHPLFDPVFYSSQLPRLARWNLDPFLHYVLYPFELDPHPLFSNEYYLRQHPELRTLGIPPLLHYLEYGFQERTNPHSSFSGPAYLDHHVDVAAARLNPLLHYATFGKAEGRQIDPVT